MMIIRAQFFGPARRPRSRTCVLVKKSGLINHEFGSSNNSDFAGAENFLDSATHTHMPFSHVLHICVWLHYTDGGGGVTGYLMLWQLKPRRCAGRRPFQRQL